MLYPDKIRNFAMQIWEELAEGRCADGLTPESLLQET